MRPPCLSRPPHQPAAPMPRLLFAALRLPSLAASKRKACGSRGGAAAGVAGGAQAALAIQSADGLVAVRLQPVREGPWGAAARAQRSARELRVHTRAQPGLTSRCALARADAAP